jgi:hypothetical protein
VPRKIRTHASYIYRNFVKPKIREVGLKLMGERAFNYHPAVILTLRFKILVRYVPQVKHSRADQI